MSSLDGARRIFFALAEGDERLFGKEERPGFYLAEGKEPEAAVGVVDELEQGILWWLRVEVGWSAGFIRVV